MDMDSESIDNFQSAIADTTVKLNYRVYLVIFLMFIFVSSNVFIEKILGKISNTVEVRYPTNKGIMIQALFIVIAVIITDFVSMYNFI